MTWRGAVRWLANLIVLQFAYKAFVIACAVVHLVQQANVDLDKAWLESQYCATVEGLRAESNVSTGLRFLLPSTGQTGTTSIIVAMRELGLKAFHVDDSSTFAHPLMKDGATPDVFARVVSRCRLDSLAIEPVVDSLPLALSVSPEAKVILSWRPYPAWSHSSMSSGAEKDINFVGITLFSGLVYYAFPWMSLYNLVTGELDQIRRETPLCTSSVAAYLHKVAFNGYWRYHNKVWTRGSYKMYTGEEAYLGHINEIRVSVPKDRLLEFDVTRDGWRELSDFVGLPPPAEGTPFPRARHKGLWSNDPHLEKHTIGRRALAWAAAMHFANTAMLGLFCTACSWRRKAR